MKKLLILILLVFFSSSVIAPAQVNIQDQTALVVDYPKFETIQHNTSFEANFYVYNGTNGVKLTGLTCSLDVFNGTGQHLLDMKTTESAGEYTLLIKNGNFTQEDEYSFNIYCNNSINGGFASGAFRVTGNGEQAPGDILVLGFAILLLFILSGSVIILVKAVGHIIDRNFDIMDLGIVWGSYFALLGAYRLSIIYLGNLEVIGWLELFVTLYAFPMVVVPVIAFFLSLFNQRKIKKREASQW